MHSFRYVGRELFCEDVALSDLVQKHGTPLYVYSQATLADHYSKLDTALAPLDHLICFAMKSNSNLAVIRTFADLGGGFDTVSACWPTVAAFTVFPNATVPPVLVSATVVPLAVPRVTAPV